MNFPKVLFLIGMLWGVDALDSFADQTLSKSQVLAAIAVFDKDPASPAGFSAGASIMTFARSSSTVHLSLSKAVVPWYKGGDETDADTRHILLTAYVAGNISTQLKSGRPADNVYAGWQQVLATYGQLLRVNSAARVSEVDVLAEKQRDGTLRAAAAEAASGR